MAQRDKRRTAPPPGGAEPDGRASGTREQAMQYCLRLLAARAYTRGQLTEKLGARRYLPNVVDEVVARLEELALVDDAAYARQWVQSRAIRTGRGRALLSKELRHRGIGDDDLRNALSSVTDEDERHAAQELVQRSLRGRRGVSELSDADVRRLAGKLARRGFSTALAYSVVREYQVSALTSAQFEEAAPSDD